jgi:hypothetical protein
MRRLPNKKTKSTLACLASLPHAALGFAPACGARLPALLDAARGCPLLVLTRGCLRVAALRVLERGSGAGRGSGR